MRMPGLDLLGVRSLLVGTVHQWMNRRRMIDDDDGDGRL